MTQTATKPNFIAEERNRQNGHHQTTEQDANARAYILSMRDDHIKPDTLPDVGKWWQCCQNVRDAFDLNPERIDKVIQSFIASKRYPGLDVLLSNVPNPGGQSSAFEMFPGRFPPLLKSAYLAPGLSKDACPELDMYEAFSRKASPRAYDDFHVFCGLWLFATIAARRVYLQIKRKRFYTNLMIAFCADTSMSAKSYTVQIAMDFLSEMKLNHLLAPDKMTPAKLLSIMSGSFIPPNYDELTEKQQERTRRRLALSGQKGLRFDEFGKFVQNMLRKNSTMADFVELFLVFDGCPPEYENATIGRGGEPIENPYIALLGNMTPTNLKENSRSGADFWTDGFWARFSFVAAPPPTLETIKCDVDDDDDDELPLPLALRAALEKYYERLKEPDCQLEPILDEKGKPTGKYRIHRENLPETACTISTEARQAWKRYDSALRQMCLTFPHQDFHGSYTRLPETAMRIAVILASLSNNNHIEIRHWARAQELAELLRKNLHELYRQVNNDTVNNKVDIEDEIIRVIYKLEKDANTADLKHHSRILKRQTAETINRMLKALCESGILDKVGSPPRYKLRPADTNKEKI